MSRAASTVRSVDADGYIWNAPLGSPASVDRYSPDGLRIVRYKVPAAQPSCPAFIGTNADRLAVTTAWEGLDEDARSTQPQRWLPARTRRHSEGRFRSSSIVI